MLVNEAVFADSANTTVFPLDGNGTPNGAQETIAQTTGCAVCLRRVLAG
jgi:hypothetical protein